MVMFRAALALFLGATGVVATSGGDVQEKKHQDAFYNEHVVVLESFDNPTHVWKEQDDPVMGGKSKGSFKIENGVGKFEGQVVDVPFLQAPGFLQARTDGDFPDISACSALQIIARSNTPYQGYRVSFGKTHAPGGKFFAYGYKASFSTNDNDEDHVNNNNNNREEAGYSVVTIPFHNFTDFWDDATGDPIKTCQDNSLYCPNEKTLKNIERLVLWAEGVAGNVSLEVKKFQAVGCTTLENVITDELV